MNTLTNTINKELKKIGNWLTANKKTKYILFRPRQKKININSQILIFNKYELNTEHKIKFPGVHVDENLTWTSHLSYIATELSKSLRSHVQSKTLFNYKSKTLTALQRNISPSHLLQYILVTDQSLIAK